MAAFSAAMAQGIAKEIFVIDVDGVSTDISGLVTTLVASSPPPAPLQTTTSAGSRRPERPPP